jgi:hypothetical protein
LGYCYRAYALAAIGRWFSEQRTYRLLPFVVAAAFVAVSLIPKNDPFLVFWPLDWRGWAVPRYYR